MVEELKLDRIPLLPEGLALSAARKVLREFEGRVDLDGEIIEIPLDVDVELIELILHQTELEIGFGSHVRATVAVGGVESVRGGIVTPGICFVVLYFSLAGKLITCDFLPASSWVR